MDTKKVEKQLSYHKLTTAEIVRLCTVTPDSK